MSNNTTQATDYLRFPTTHSDSINHLKLPKCFILGCARQCESFIDPVFRNILTLSQLFSHVCVIVAYDESYDNTLELLHEYKKNCPELCMEILTTDEPLSHIRTQRISNARNRLLKCMRSKYSAGWDYFIMMDMDDVCSRPIKPDVIQSYFARTDWDALSFNRPDYYDVWALSFYPFVISCWNWGSEEQCSSVVNQMRREIKSMLNRISPTSLLECYSAFNGFCIYRYSKFEGCQYDWLTIDLNMLERGAVVRNIDIVQYQPQLRPAFDDCEHRAFHRQAIITHNAKIRISPKMCFEF